VKTDDLSALATLANVENKSMVQNDHSHTIIVENPDISGATVTGINARWLKATFHLILYPLLP
jgi:hypothetical protein